MLFPVQYEFKFSIDFPIRGFFIPINGIQLKVLASIEPGDWEHVSVSLSDRIPTWEEMCIVKDYFFDPEEICIQIHPKKSQYINLHPNCLHLWKPPAAIGKLLENPS